MSFVWLEITGKCQLECAHCYAESGPSGMHGSMMTADWHGVIDQAAANDSARRDLQGKRGRVAVDKRADDEHPAWCSPTHCFATDERVRVHQQAPTRWDVKCVVPLRFKTCLIDPADDDTTYLELHMRDLKMRNQFYGRSG